MPALPKRICAAAFAVLLALPAHAGPTDDAVKALKKDEPYALQRLGLIEAGWKPDYGADADPDPEARCSFRTEICLAYPEAESCSGTGMAFCSFRFTDADGKVLFVTTAGEPLSELTVYGWELN